MKAKTSVGLLTLYCIFLVGISLLPTRLNSQNKERNLRGKEVDIGTAVAVGGIVKLGRSDFPMKLSAMLFGFTTDFA
jgi:hypothetical protein